LAGLRRARELGCAWVEFDVRLTADGALVLCHDGRLERTTTGHGRVAAQTLATIRGCDAGSWFHPDFAGERMPTLDEALDLARELDLAVNIEIKANPGRAPATAAAAIASLRRLGSRSPTVLLSSFLTPALAALRDLAPEVPRGLLLRLVPRGWRGLMARFGCATLNTDHRRLKPRLVSEIRAAGYPLLAYTVNDPRRARALFDWGVTSVFSDVPDIILPVSVEEPARRVAARPPSSDAPRQGALW
jgi:glycerophosphoryl diester phosphodiesterase